MKKLFFISTVCLLTCACSAQNIMLLPFVGKDGSEVILAFDKKSGISAEWYFNQSTQKMARAASGGQLPSNPGVSAPFNMEPYIGNDNTEVVLVWNANGQSVSWYYDETAKKMTRSDDAHQLPANIGLEGNVMMHGYVGADKSEVILCWDTKTGRSVQYYFDQELKKFREADDKFQLPADVGLTDDVMMYPYIGADGTEITLTWNKVTGKSVAWYFDDNLGRYVKAKPGFQLPATPALTGNVMMYPYVGNDSSEVILTWNISTGKSLSYYLDNATKTFTKSPPEYQLPADLGVGGNLMMCPVVVKSKDEVIYTWNAATGRSANYYFDKELKKYKKSEAKWQLPPNLLN